MATAKRKHVGESSRPGPWEELSLVRLARGREDHGVLYPKGTIGTIVDVRALAPRLFEVEFAEPVPTVMTLTRDDITPEPWPEP